MHAVATMLVALTGSASFLSLANGQAHTVNDNKTLLNDSSDGASTTNKPLPVLLIHGYASDASIWSKWEDLLKKDGIIFYPITFYKSDDKCGSAADHAKELNIQVQQTLNNMTMTSWKTIKRLLYNKDSIVVTVKYKIVKYKTDTKDIKYLAVLCYSWLFIQPFA